MAVINDTSNSNTSEEVAYSKTSMMNEVITEKSGLSVVVKYKEVEEEEHYCCVLGYN